MANVAECAIAISKADIKRLPDNAITRAESGVEGYEQTNGYTRDGHRYTESHQLDGKTEYYKDGKSCTYEDWAERIDWTTYKRGTDVVYSNGWRLDLVALHLCPYQTSVDVVEYDDHITLYFGGRWAFPQDTEDYLNSLDIEWQGAVAEGGCEVYDSQIGTADFGLRWYKGKDEDGYTNWWVEDTTGMSEEDLSKFEKEQVL